MAVAKPYEMSFAEFAEAIRPGWVISVANPFKPTTPHSEWLTSIWDSTDNRCTYSIYWINDALKNELPPEAQEYQFDDLSLFPITARLGLDPESDADNSKAAEVLAIRNAWVTSIQHHYGQSATDTPRYTLTKEASAEYVLLTSGLIHPWIQEIIQRHIAKQNRKKLEQADIANRPVEMSSDPNWPSAQVIHAHSDPLLAQEQAWREEKMKDIGYWLEEFRSADGMWASEFEMDTWYAQRDIDVTGRKIAELQNIIEKQKQQIQRVELTIREIKRREAKARVLNNDDNHKLGRPNTPPERQQAALRFTSQWVESLMKTLNVKNCAQLENIIDGSRQRNWRRWLNGEKVPNFTDLTALAHTRVRHENYNGKLLEDLPTNPCLADLLSLINLT